MKLSKNLSLQSDQSTTAKRLGIDNTPDEWVTETEKLQSIFQPLRDHFGRPIFVSSGYRSPDLNVAIGGSKRSQHVEEEHLTLMETCSDVYQTLTSSATYSTTLRLISSFGNLVMTIILIGFTSLSFMMALIVAGASKLCEMITEKCTTK